MMNRRRRNGRRHVDLDAFFASVSVERDGDVLVFVRVDTDDDITAGGVRA